MAAVGNFEDSGIDSSGSSKVKVAKGTYRKVVALRVLKVLSSVFLILLVLYGVFATTLLRVAPTNIGLIPVKNTTFENGFAPAEAQLLISINTPQGYSFTDRAKQAFLPTNDAALVQIIAGPYGALNWTEPDILTVDGYPTNVHLEPEEGDKSPLESRDKFLKDEYLAICLKGACVEGDGIIFEADRIMGTPLTRASVDKVFGR